MVSKTEGLGDLIEVTAILAALVGVLGWLLRQAWRSQAKTDAALDSFTEQEKRRQEAERAAAKERDETDGLDDDAIRERLRQRRRIWRGL